MGGLEEGGAVRRRSLLSHSPLHTAHFAHTVSPPSLARQLDQYIDIPPFTPDTGGDDHLKILIGRLATTSLGLILRRPA